MSVDHKNGEDSVDPPSTIAGLWVLILFILPLAIAAIYFLPEWIVVQRYEAGPILETEIPSKADIYRRTMVLAMGGVVMIVGLYITLRPIRPADRQAHEMVEAGPNLEFSSMSIPDLTKWVWSRWWGLGSAYRWGLGVLLIVALALLAFAAYGIFWWPRGATDIENLTEFQQQQLAGDRRLFSIQLAGALIVFAGLYLTFRRIKASERRVQAVEDGQVTERFSRAIEHLGSEKMGVRLGGIYALERIAKDSPGDHWTVMETLSAFVRKRSVEERKESKVLSDEDNHNNPVEDIVAVLNVIGRRNVESEPLGARVDLSGLYLSNMQIRGLNFKNIKINNIYITQCGFADCFFKNVSIFSGSVLSSAVYISNIKSLHLDDVEVDGFAIRRSNIKMLYARKSNIKSISLSECHINKMKIFLGSIDINNFSGSRFDSLNLDSCSISRMTKNSFDKEFGEDIGRYHHYSARVSPLESDEDRTEG